MMWSGILVAVSALGQAQGTAEPPRRVLILVSNVAHLGDEERHEAKNNLWEVAPPFHVFRLHGFEVDFASPEGGPVPFSMEVDQTDPPGMITYAIKYEGFREKAGASIPADAVDPRRYSAVFIGGGLGPLVDVASNPGLQRVIGAVYDQGGAVGACGHGPGSLARARDRNGDYLVKDKRVTGFPNSSEINSRWSKGGTLLPFLVEDALRAAGARFLTKADLADKHDVIVDQRIVTTMFLPSCAIVAEEVARLVDGS